MVNQKKLKLTVFFVIPLILLILEFCLKPFLLNLRPYNIAPDYFKFDIPFMVLSLICIIVYFLIFGIKLLKNDAFLRIYNKFITQRKDYTKAIPFIFGLISVILIFTSKDLINQDIIFQYDYSFHYYFSWYLNNYLLPTFKSIFGFSNLYYAGHPIIAFYPPGIYLFQYLLGFLGLNFNISTRILMGITIFGYFYIPYKKLKDEHESESTIIICMFSLFLLSYWLKFIEFGQIAYLLSAELGFYLIFDFSHKLKINKANYLRHSTKYWHILLIIVISLLHFMSIIIVFIYFFIDLVYKKFILNNSYKMLKTEIKSVFIYGVFAILANSMYLLPNLFVSSSYFLTNVEYEAIGFLGFATSAGTIILFSFFIPFFAIFMILIGLVNRPRVNVTDRKRFSSIKSLLETLFLREYAVESIFMLFLWIIMIFSIFFRSLGFYTVDLWGLMRLIAYTIPIMAIGISLFFKRVYISITKERKTQERSIRHFFNIFILIFLCMSSYTFYDFLYPSTDHDSIDRNIPPWLVNYQRASESYVELQENVSQVFEWISTHKSQDFRIGVEESGLVSNFKWGGYSLATLGALYNASFIGGYFHVFGTFYKKIFQSTIYEGRFFTYEVNGTLSEPDNQEVLENIEERLKDLNIKYLIFWSQNLIEFANRNSDVFTFQQNFDDFVIFEYKNAINSYIRTSNSYISYQNLIFEQNQIAAYFTNCSKDDFIQISIQHYHNWHIFLNDTQIQPYTTFDLIEFEIPSSGNYQLRIIWLQSNYEIIGVALCLFSIVLLGLAYLNFILRGSKRKVLK